MSTAIHQFAQSKEEATHRYPTEVLWGIGYFGDGYKYICLPDRKDAETLFLTWVRNEAGAFIDDRHLQVREGEGWRFYREQKKPLTTGQSTKLYRIIEELTNLIEDLHDENDLVARDIAKAIVELEIARRR